MEDKQRFSTSLERESFYSRRVQVSIVAPPPYGNHEDNELKERVTKLEEGYKRLDSIDQKVQSLQVKQERLEAKQNQEIALLVALQKEAVGYQKKAVAQIKAYNRGQQAINKKLDMLTKDVKGLKESK